MADPSGQSSEASRGRGWRRAWVALAFLAVIGTGIAAWRTTVHVDIEQHRARLREEREEIAALPRGRPALVEPAAAGDAAAVMAAFLDAVEAVPREERDRLLPFDEEVTAEERDSILEAHPEPLARLEPLLAVLSAPPAPTTDLVQPGGPIERIQAGARWLKAVGDRAVARGDVALARRVALLEMAYGAEVAWGGHIIYDLVGCGVQDIGARHMAAALATAVLPVPEARRAGVALDRLAASRFRAVDVLAIDRASFRAQLLDPALGEHFASRAVARDPALARLDAAADEISVALSLGETNAPAAVAGAKAVGDKKDDPPLVRMWTVIVPMWARKRFTTVAWIRVVRAALAVSEAAAIRGALPGSLAELVPEFLPAVPVDPWDGKPLRYRAGTLWSIGSDGKDDGGTPPENPDDTSTGDYVVTVPPP